MKHLAKVTWFTVGIGLLSTAWAQQAPSLPETQHIESSWDAIARCADLIEDESRHECLDDVLREAGLLAASGTTSSRKSEPFGLERSTARPESRTGTAEPHTSQAPERVEVTLASVEERGDGKLVLTTTDGAEWRQVESDPIHPTPREGQAMTITKARLGGYMCKPNKWVTFRCYRAR